MRIWWCANHKLVGDAWCVMKDKAAGPCRMVPMRLIPDNAEKVIHGVLRAWNPDLNDFAIQSCAIAVMAALDGETP